ncbi:aminoacyl-tRNA hydrolase [Candidatus Micrarchaeota archaeon CG_4_10_14_0_2_um_filter_60_11]|nr:MAG: aminoacyl-tRNA hydrolase [Candidatus Micrarchaeota archaeon CG1_02_60_51]PIN96327.1 MAG: aminoacyl-tRNA hydrolase [Candidatus Micrarchaeota archaeon CG10_big_fil_rev_8_21_14_0_10_60_32]PIO01980.1 MAG: aminoacyl-tRNA hydrolase [Candidatus Micrarchaeota archaeon CG09_land_8_20_14_0_10_60_16]PIY91358.1 MAG: aminoacyl-tRNA hydrolase [Candidatus Micrarchaeota archaeon CG_4_10_14_0_8_um_filter_60_7]PIZ90968.1 MAG: aminoacyl-tRNA hydrolase [Candidatus Micrarchaeota archaeon CG_4_10_14_0_2_um_f
MFKQAIVLRSDLEMGKGKLVAQGSHASLEAFIEAQKSSALTVAAWRSTGCKKITLKVSSEAELKELYSKAKRLKLPCSLVRDAGHTQVEPGTITALAIGPAADGTIDKVTGGLKLL